VIIHSLFTKLFIFYEIKLVMMIEAMMDMEKLQALNITTHHVVQSRDVRWSYKGDPERYKSPLLAYFYINNQQRHRIIIRN